MYDDAMTHETESVNAISNNDWPVARLLDQEKVYLEYENLHCGCFVNRNMN